MRPHSFTLVARFYIAGGLMLYIAGGLAWFMPRPAPSVTVAPSDHPSVALGAAELRRALTPPEAHAMALIPVPVLARRWSVSARIDGTLGLEEYAVRPDPVNGRIDLSGGAPMGLAYGMYGLAEDLRLKRQYLEYPLPLVRRPAKELRLVSDPLEPSYPPVETALALGFNAVMTEPWPALALHDGLHDDAGRSWVLQRRDAARQRIEHAKALGMKVYAPGDLILLPRAAGARLCLEDSRIRGLVAAGLDEVFREFPDLDGVVVRTGENYPLGPLWGNTPCGNLSEAVSFMHEQVVLKHRRDLILRAWDLGADGYHARSDRFQEIAREGVTFSFKVTQTDFWRYNALNPNLRDPAGPFESLKERPPGVALPAPYPEALEGLEGQGSRMVEFQAAREFEGKGAFPNYVAPVYLEGLRQANAGFAWVWAKGGGWGGPNPTADIWIDANVYAMAHLLWDPSAEPMRLAEDWAGLRFGPGAAPHLAALLMKSPDAVLKGFYLQCYGQRYPGWAPNLLWTRDDIIAGGERIEPMYRACQAEVEAAVQEKQESLALVDAMLEDLERARPYLDPPAARWMEASLLYQRSLFEVLAHYLTGMFRYYAGDAAGAREAFEALRGSWEAHNGAVSTHAATPYRDAGMWRTVTSSLGL